MQTPRDHGMPAESNRLVERLLQWGFLRAMIMLEIRRSLISAPDPDALQIVDEIEWTFRSCRLKFCCVEHRHPTQTTLWVPRNDNTLLQERLISALQWRRRAFDIEATFDNDVQNSKLWFCYLDCEMTMRGLRKVEICKFLHKRRIRTHLRWERPEHVDSNLVGYAID